jgi:hypothetical protein
VGESQHRTGCDLSVHAARRGDSKLSCPDFIERAPEAIIEDQLEEREAVVARTAKILEPLERLKKAA